MHGGFVHIDSRAATLRAPSVLTSVAGAASESVPGLASRPKPAAGKPGLESGPMPAAGKPGLAAGRADGAPSVRMLVATAFEFDELS